LRPSATKPCRPLSRHTKSTTGRGELLHGRTRTREVVKYVKWFMNFTPFLAHSLYITYTECGVKWRELDAARASMTLSGSAGEVRDWPALPQDPLNDTTLGRIPADRVRSKFDTCPAHSQPHRCAGACDGHAVGVAAASLCPFAHPELMLL